MTFKRKTKRIIGLFLIIATCIVAIAALGAGRNKADKGFDLVNLDFERGSLDATGKYSEVKSSIYTKEAFECGSELRIKLDFDSNVTYRIFFYDEDDQFISSTDEYDETVTATVPEGAFYARLVVTPEWDADVDKDDQIVRTWNVRKYAKQVTVMVVPVKDA